MMERIDLHIHTTCSDGVLSPKEIIDKAIQNGVSIISITDHDTIDAYNDELYDVFSDYDYVSRKYSNSLKEKVEYTEEIDEELIDKLDTYKYTFKRDDVDYFLVGIDKLGK